MTAAAATLVDLPTTREEAWRYTPVDEIVARLDRGAAATTANGSSALSRARVDALSGSQGRLRLVFVNGFYAPELSDLDDLPAGLWCGRADERPPTTASPALIESLAAADGFVARNHTARHDDAVVIADDGVRLDEPVHIVHVAVPDPGDAPSVVANPRTLIDVGEGSRLAVVETYGSLDGQTVTNASTTVRIRDGGELDHCRIQLESAAATHIGHTRIDQGAGSRFTMTSATVGGDIARNAIDVHLDAPDARTELGGINMTTGRQRHDTVVTVDHAASRCSSTQRYAGVVDDHGRSSFSGEIIVRPRTCGTDAHQSNRNLVLDVNAEADTRPWLRILADDVSCTHGATVGRLDDEALLYLRSRGIALATARAMLIDAFVRQATDAISHESVREHVAARVLAAATETKEQA